MLDDRQRRRFEAEIMPLMPEAYNLARWIVKNDHDAEDVVQEAYLRAFRFFAGRRTDNARSWLLRIVRNTSYDLTNRRKTISLDTNLDSVELTLADPDQPDPAKALQQQSEQAIVREAIAALAPEHREVIILRELQDLSYREIAEVMGVPIGTVMSRLSRAREQLATFLLNKRAEGDV